GIIFGLSLSVASTVVLLRALQDRAMINTNDGRIATGWLIVEDLLMVLALVLLPALMGVLGADVLDKNGSLWAAVGITIGKVAVFIGLMLVAGVRFFPWLLSRVARASCSLSLWWRSHSVWRSVPLNSLAFLLPWVRFSPEW